MKHVHLLPEERKVLRQIASFYGCKIYFNKNVFGGQWFGDYIILGYAPTYKRLISLFCHELAHFINWKTGKYPIYHNPKNFGRMKKVIPDYLRMIRYSLNAEVFTEKQGAKLCKEWFPGIEYEGYYKNNKVCFEFLYGYYLRG